MSWPGGGRNKTIIVRTKINTLQFSNSNVRPRKYIRISTTTISMRSSCTIFQSISNKPERSKAISRQVLRTSSCMSWINNKTCLRSTSGTSWSGSYSFLRTFSSTRKTYFSKYMTSCWNLILLSSYPSRNSRSLTFSSTQSSPWLSLSRTKSQSLWESLLSNRNNLSSIKRILARIRIKTSSIKNKIKMSLNRMIWK